MCLTVSPRFPKLYVADRDITCWKLLSNTCRSIHYDFKYVPNMLYRNHTIEIVDGVIHEGFHGYLSLHDHTLRESYFLTVEFTIPKGATYAIGSALDIVSDQIRSGSLKRVTSLEYTRKFNKNIFWKDL